MRPILAVLLTLFLLAPAAVLADPCLLVYPLDVVVFRYDPLTYEVVSPSDPGFDPAYAVSGEVLWNVAERRIATEIYRAPGLVGFETSYDGKSEFFTVGNKTKICVDGFSEYPRQLNDIVVEFVPFPVNSSPDVYVNGERIDGLRYVIPRMVVSTETEDGFYSDTFTFNLRWLGSQFIGIIVYADKNANRVFDGEPCYSVMMEDWTVPTATKTWGSIKELYKAD